MKLKLDEYQNNNCPKCELLMELYNKIPEQNRTNRDYWIFTELFFWLHKNRDYCDGQSREKYDKFILFQYDDCYPAGGLNDIFGSFDNKQEAIDKAGKSRYNNIEIVDRDTWEIIYDK